MPKDDSLRAVVLDIARLEGRVRLLAAQRDDTILEAVARVLDAAKRAPRALEPERQAFRDAANLLASAVGAPAGKYAAVGPPAAKVRDAVAAMIPDDIASHTGAQLSALAPKVALALWVARCMSLDGSRVLPDAPSGNALAAITPAIAAALERVQQTSEDTSPRVYATNVVRAAAKALGRKDTRSLFDADRKAVERRVTKRARRADK